MLRGVDHHCVGPTFRGRDYSMRSRGRYERPPAGLINSARRSENLSHVRGSPGASLSAVYLNMLIVQTELRSRVDVAVLVLFCDVGAGCRTDCTLYQSVTWHIIGYKQVDLAGWLQW